MYIYQTESLRLNIQNSLVDSSYNSDSYSKVVVTSPKYSNKILENSDLVRFISQYI